MRDDQVYLRDILDAIRRIESYTSVGREAFLNTELYQDAVIRQLAVIGEASRKLSESLRASHAEVPWPRIFALRNLLIHDYAGVSLETVWKITEENLPLLKKQVQVILDGLA